ncbi:hypothetical protein LQD23_16320 [Chromobacterium violaceum]|uniref:hypothetical protein n=1 Tax=Chromobacterium violaceum TaxID=536 RepID=UPI001E4DB809|nr:hypothetical protein [Chromobacterium violaceum]MCD0493847.1 hypothetical protein [Chromobacterium violaceum]
MRTSVVIVAAAMALAGCNSNQDEANAPEKSVTAPPAEPAHNFVVEDKGLYGYESALTEEDQKNGRSSGNVVMIRYLGKKNGLETIFIGSDIVTCKTPCEYAKSVSLLTNEQQYIHATPSSLLHAMFEDASNGVLKEFGSQEPLQAQGHQTEAAQAAVQPISDLTSIQEASSTAAAIPTVASAPNAQ